MNDLITVVTFWVYFFWGGEHDWAWGGAWASEAQAGALMTPVPSPVEFYTLRGRFVRCQRQLCVCTEDGEEWRSGAFWGVGEPLGGIYFASGYFFRKRGR